MQKANVHPHIFYFCQTILALIVVWFPGNSALSIEADTSPQTPTSVTGKAVLKGTAPDSPLIGEISLTESEEGLIIEANMEHVPDPGKHGFHIHEFGDCSDTGNAAGGHFNPMSAPHGFLPENGLTHAHAGDMGNMDIDENGSGHLHVVLPDVTLISGPHPVAGRAIIIHAKEDDFGQPTGNAGGRIGCGTIIIVKN